jgi:hypothetical protein
LRRGSQGRSTGRNGGPRARFLIVCESQRTEPLYFAGLQRELRFTCFLDIRRCTTCGAPADLVQRAVCVRAESGRDGVRYDAVWCVFDADQHDSATLRSAWDAARKAGIGVALSNPCFEFWFLLHHEHTTRPMPTAAHALDELRRHIPNYEKSRSVYAALRDKQPQALENAVRVRTHHEADLGGTTDYQWNPYTTVDLLVSRLRDMMR